MALSLTHLWQTISDLGHQIPVSLAPFLTTAWASSCLMAPYPDSKRDLS
jgi:hypothetical protein